MINLPLIDIASESQVLPAALENKTAVRNSDILTADINWLGRTYSCENYNYTILLECVKMAGAN